jgi:hypothetical protein
MNNIKEAGQLPFVDELFLSTLICKMIKSTTAPDNKRIEVKLEASRTFSPNANRQSTEFAAKAIITNTVQLKVFINRGLGLANRSRSGTPRVFSFIAELRY